MVILKVTLLLKWHKKDTRVTSSIVVAKNSRYGLGSLGVGFTTIQR